MLNSFKFWKWKSLFVTSWTIQSWNSLGQTTGVGSLSFLQEIFPTQGLNPGLSHCRQILYLVDHKGNPRILEWVAYPFSSRSSRPRNQTGVSWIAGGFFTNWAIREALKNTNHPPIFSELSQWGVVGSVDTLQDCHRALWPALPGERWAMRREEP